MELDRAPRSLEFKVPGLVPSPEDMSEEGKEVYKLFQSYAWTYNPFIQTPPTEEKFFSENKKVVIFQCSNIPTMERYFFIKIKHHNSDQVQRCHLQILNNKIRFVGSLLDRAPDTNLKESIDFSFDPKENIKHLHNQLIEEHEENVLLQILSIIYSNSYCLGNGEFLKSKVDTPSLIESSNISSPLQVNQSFFKRSVVK